MSMPYLTTEAEEGSTYIVTATFEDEYGDSVIPTAITWTLTDPAGNVINSREDVAVSSPAASINIVLSGDDLDISNGNKTDQMILTVDAVYNSDNGTGLPLKDSVLFTIRNLKKVSRSLSRI